MTSRICSTDPVSGQVVWRGRSTSPGEAHAAMRRAAEAWHDWRRSDLSLRIEIVERFGQRLSDHQETLTDLISREVGKLPWDAAAEVMAAIAKTKLSIDALHTRRHRTSLEPTGSEVERIVRYLPLGATLVLGPYNFPLHLPGGQIIPSLLAGNTVVFKPSESATAVGKWIAEAWLESGLPENVLQWIPGGVETAAAAIESENLSAVYLTGSLAAGKAIHRQLAGRPEVMLALELGGNNPIVVLPDSHSATNAPVVSHSAFVSAGQRCTCARRAIYVDGPDTDAQIQTLIDHVRSLRCGTRLDKPTPHIGPLVSVEAVDRLHSAYERLRDLGCRPLIDWNDSYRESDSSQRCLVSPILLQAVDLSSSDRRALGELEWFGPMLVLERVEDFATAVRSAATTPYGLAAALLGGQRDDFELFVNEVRAGVVNWNGPTTGAAGQLPFGGLGVSGNHRPAGYFAIDFCNDPVASLQREVLPDADPWSVVR